MTGTAMHGAGLLQSRSTTSPVVFLAGYLALAATGYLTGWLAAQHRCQHQQRDYVKAIEDNLSELGRQVAALRHNTNELRDDHERVHAEVQTLRGVRSEACATSEPESEAANPYPHAEVVHAEDSDTAER